MAMQGALGETFREKLLRISNRPSISHVLCGIFLRNYGRSCARGKKKCVGKVHSEERAGVISRRDSELFRRGGPRQTLCSEKTFERRTTWGGGKQIRKKKGMLVIHLFKGGRWNTLIETVAKGKSGRSNGKRLQKKSL